MNLDDTLALALTYHEFYGRFEDYRREHEYSTWEGKIAWDKCQQAWEDVERNSYFIQKLAKII